MWYPGPGVLDCIDSGSLPSFLLFLVDPFYMVCSFYRLSLPCTTTIVFSAYVSTEANNDIVNIKSTTCNCIVVTYLTKLAISIFLGKIEVNL